MRKFTIEVTWTMVAQVEVEAPSRREAIEKVRKAKELPNNGVYLDDSFQIDEKIPDSG